MKKELSTLTNEDLTNLKRGCFRSIQLLLSTHAFISADLPILAEYIVRAGYICQLQKLTEVGVPQCGIWGYIQNLRPDFSKPEYSHILPLALVNTNTFVARKMVQFLLLRGIDEKWHDYEALYRAFKDCSDLNIPALFIDLNAYDKPNLIRALDASLSNSNALALFQMLIHKSKSNSALALILSSYFDSCVLSNDVVTLTFLLKAGINPNQTNALVLALERRYDHLVVLLLDQIMVIPKIKAHEAMFIAMENHQTQWMKQIKERSKDEDMKDVPQAGSRVVPRNIP